MSQNQLGITSELLHNIKYHPRTRDFIVPNTTDPSPSWRAYIHFIAMFPTFMEPED